MPISRRGKCNDLLVTIPALYDYNIERISLLLSPSSQSQQPRAFMSTTLLPVFISSSIMLGTRLRSAELL